MLIGIERSFAVGAATPGSPVTGNTIRLYPLDARGATDVSGLDSIAGVAGLQSAKKTLLLDLSDLKNDDVSASGWARWGGWSGVVAAERRAPLARAGSWRAGLRSRAG